MSERRSQYIAYDDGEAVLLDYYDGANGRTLRIDIQTLESLKALIRLFEEFSHRPPDAEVSLRSLPQALFVPPLADVRLQKSRTLEIGVQQEPKEKTIFVKWSQPGDDWDDASELLKQLAKPERGNSPGHQYLTNFGTNVLVVVAFRE